MGSSITASTLVVSISERIELGGVDRDSRSVNAITSVGEIYNRILSVETAGTDIISFAGEAGSGTFVSAASGAGSISYIRMTNLDKDNSIAVTCSDNATGGSAVDLFAVTLLPGRTFMLGGLAFDTAAGGVTIENRSSAVGSGTPDTVTLADANSNPVLITDNDLTAGGTIAHIRAVASTDPCDLEVYIASQ